MEFLYLPLPAAAAPVFASVLRMGSAILVVRELHDGTISSIGLALQE